MTLKGFTMKRTLVLSALAVASTLVLAACGEATELGNIDATTSATSTATTEADGEISADHNDADIMFAQMMIPHHQQAVEMSEMLLAKEGIPAQVVEFAQGVIDAQEPEIDRMNAMLEAWGQQPVTDSGGMETMDEMGGMDHGEMGAMSGMMSQEDMTALEESQGTEAARLYLEQMIAHHEGAVDIARDEVADGQNSHAITLAEQIINDQEAEIAQIQQMLTDL
ncbi:DUF305 domain-containing protein [Corynebacterium macginleyi]|nr:DUF305 domain-containing protein [Corynebacterium macginleyi]MBK4146785.1 DUF305 domain-containing protein [Corynebacterium macginleyi]MBK4148473.1 DUF305 domain-containing protein [Corynebacterium macginleyi]MBK4159921.1 DUF305 domain-containing protein [Corynebacterium macginleyi]MBK4177988.1 DUF305 domain-containing protein [Corynebacterium macginleyi]